MSKPAIATINGHAHGAGFNLALGCDQRMMADIPTPAIPILKARYRHRPNLLQQFVGIGNAME
jgi:hypothetical protein